MIGQTGQWDSSRLEVSAVCCVIGGTRPGTRRKHSPPSLFYTVPPQAAILLFIPLCLFPLSERRRRKEIQK